MRFLQRYKLFGRDEFICVRYIAFTGSKISEKAAQPSGIYNDIVFHIIDIMLNWYSAIIRFTVLRLSYSRCYAR